MTPLSAQTGNDASSSKDLFNTLARLDSTLFSIVYSCDTARSGTFVTEDLEFYHDKGGLTRSRKVFLEALYKNFCNTPIKLRRELVKGSLQVYPIANYGAMQMGEHRFYISENGQPEKLTGVAKFMHLWHYENNEWKISRVFSLDHAPASN
jgi:hypothetical protein